MRCNNRDDLLHLSFTLMELILRKYKADKHIHKKAPS